MMESCNIHSNHLYIIYNHSHGTNISNPGKHLILDNIFDTTGIKNDKQFKALRTFLCIVSQFKQNNRCELYKVQIIQTK